MKKQKLIRNMGGRMQKQGDKSPRNKPSLRLNLVLLKLVFKWYAETWFKLGLTKPSLFKLSLRGKYNTFTHISAT